MPTYCPTCSRRFGDDAAACPDDGTALLAVARRDLVGQTVDRRHHVLRRLGEGAMGVVYEAEQELIGRRVALKVLHEEVARNEDTVKRFLTEARATSALTGTHTVTLFDFGVTDEGLLYYTMELLSGRTLAEAIDAEGPFAPERALGVLEQCCASLEEAHGHKILHRDLKPENVFLEHSTGPDGESHEHVKVLDFGIAKLLGDDDESRVTRTGTVCGTPAYVAPERALGERARESSDLYALGVILYEMLSSYPPFDGESVMRTLLQHVREEPPSLTSVNPEVRVPESVQELLNRLLAKSPDDRPSSVAALRREVAELRARLEGVHPDAPPPPGGSRPSGPQAVHAPTAPGTASAVASGRDGDVDAADAGAAPPTGTRRARSPGLGRIALVAALVVGALGAGTAWWATTRDDGVSAGGRREATSGRRETSAGSGSAGAQAGDPSERAEEARGGAGGSLGEADGGTAGRRERADAASGTPSPAADARAETRAERSVGGDVSTSSAASGTGSDGAERRETTQRTSDEGGARAARAGADRSTPAESEAAPSEPETSPSSAGAPEASASAVEGERDRAEPPEPEGTTSTGEDAEGGPAPSAREGTAEEDEGDEGDEGDEAADGDSEADGSGGFRRLPASEGGDEEAGDGEAGDSSPERTDEPADEETEADDDDGSGFKRLPEASDD